MLITLDEMKQYLRVDHDDDDSLIDYLINSSEKLCMDVAREEDMDTFESYENAKMAVMYAVASRYEHREELDHNALNLSLRALLFGNREEGF